MSGMTRPYLHNKECNHSVADPTICDSCKYEYERELDHYIFSLEEQLIDLKNVNSQLFS